jgi:hypothetical protein
MQGMNVDAWIDQWAGRGVATELERDGQKVREPVAADRATAGALRNEQCRPAQLGALLPLGGVERRLPPGQLT